MTTETSLEPRSDVPTDSPEPDPSLMSRVVGLFLHPKTPLVVGAVLVLCVAGFMAKRLHIALPFVQPAIVVFDPVRFVNAQRAAASIMAVSPSADISLTLTQVAKQSEAVIKEEARGAVVLVKQSVVVPDGLTDITDAVLERFGLPTEVPTISTRPSQLTLDGLAPTDSSLSSGKLREDYRMELKSRSQQLMAEDGKREKQSQVLP